jgi:hypothetical protein
VTAVRFEWLLDGAVCRITKRPPNTKAERVMEVLKAMDAKITKGEAITATTKLGPLGRVVVAESDAVEVKLNSGKAKGTSVYPTLPGADGEEEED